MSISGHQGDSCLGLVLFSRIINDLGEEVNNTLIHSADDTKNRDIYQVPLMRLGLLKGISNQVD